MSFNDAPGGVKEEFQEVRWGAGVEYSYNKQFFARVGYSYESFNKGNRNYFTLGAGFHLSIVTLDISYCAALASTNPLNNTMRFTLGFDLYGIKDLVNNKKTKPQLNGQRIRRNFLQRRGINGKQVCKKLLNISLYHSLVVVVI